MKAFKGFSPDLTSRLGDGKKENCTFRPGETKEVESSKTVRSGFHCCENPFECLRYYTLGTDRFFEVEAKGDIDEDEDERIACTKITLVKELTKLDMALAGMTYIVNHPQRRRWEQNHKGCIVAREQAEAEQEGDIAIARGKNPKAKGPAGAILGIMQEDKNGEIMDATLIVVHEENADKWITLKNRKAVECV
ncbi:MAG: hypothetical protein K6E75_03430 [Lachnospiraceae bacterium]|nr:hypothetical protein [Lachnospiraceae bacterium]